MKAHNGMRPQDIVILLKIITLRQEEWQYRDMASSISISISEISQSLNRSHLAGLIDESRRRVYKKSLYEFIEYGLHYVFPDQPGTMVTGMSTAHSHPYFKKMFASEIDYVWPYGNGMARGLSISPLHAGVPMAAEKDEELYQLLAAIDILRVGRVREIKEALIVLRKAILNE